MPGTHGRRAQDTNASRGAVTFRRVSVRCVLCFCELCQPYLWFPRPSSYMHCRACRTRTRTGPGGPRPAPTLVNGRRCSSVNVRLDDPRENHRTEELSSWSLHSGCQHPFVCARYAAEAECEGLSSNSRVPLRWWNPHHRVRHSLVTTIAVTHRPVHFCQTDVMAIPSRSTRELETTCARFIHSVVPSV